MVLLFNQGSGVGTVYNYFVKGYHSPPKKNSPRKITPQNTTPTPPRKNLKRPFFIFIFEQTTGPKCELKFKNMVTSSSTNYGIIVLVLII